jgi:hypothetical protein
MPLRTVESHPERTSTKLTFMSKKEKERIKQEIIDRSRPDFRFYDNRFLEKDEVLESMMGYRTKLLI